MIDIDYFKKYNDTYGHPAGDECLQAVSGMIKNTVRRNTDLIARIGGEEFIAVVQEVDKTDLIFLAKKIQRNIEKLEIAHDNSLASSHVTVSLGLAYMNNAREKEYGILYKMADKSLYKAKMAGRNCIALGDHVITRVSNEKDVLGQFDEYKVRKA